MLPYIGQDRMSLNGRILLYAFKVSTGQTIGSSGKLGKKKSAKGRDDLLCLDKWVGLNTTPFYL